VTLREEHDPWSVHDSNICNNATKYTRMYTELSLHKIQSFYIPEDAHMFGRNM